MVRQAGLFDLEERLTLPSAKGDGLERLAAVVDFELFRPELEAAVPRLFALFDRQLRAAGRHLGEEPPSFGARKMQRPGRAVSADRHAAGAAPPARPVLLDEDLAAMRGDLHAEVGEPSVPQIAVTLACARRRWPAGKGNGRRVSRPDTACQ